MRHHMAARQQLSRERERMKFPYDDNERPEPFFAVSLCLSAHFNDALWRNEVKCLLVRVSFSASSSSL